MLQTVLDSIRNWCYPKPSKNSLSVIFTVPWHEKAPHDIQFNDFFNTVSPYCVDRLLSLLSPCFPKSLARSSSGARQYVFADFKFPFLFLGRGVAYVGSGRVVYRKFSAGQADDVANYPFAEVRGSDSIYS